MGLLRKARDNINSLAISNTPSILNSSICKKKNQIESFLTDINKIKPGFEYSDKLFKLLTVFLNISKGALLVREPESSTFIPTSFINFDITTTRHLRVPGSVFDKYLNYFNKIISIEDKNIKQFKQYLSIREYSALNSIILIPFYFRKNLSAMLLIIDPSENCLININDISSNSDIFTNKLIKSKKLISTKSKVNSSTDKLDPTYILQNYIDKNNSKEINFLIISINFTLLRDSLIKLLPNTDSYEISNNIIKSIYQLITPSGILVKILTDKHLVFYKLKKGKTSGIILHQINLAISSFFNISDSLPNIDAQIKSFNNTESAETMLEGII